MGYAKEMKWPDKCKRCNEEHGVTVAKQCTVFYTDKGFAKYCFLLKEANCWGIRMVD